MKHEKFEQLVQRYLRGESSPAETRRVEQWYEALDNASPAELSPASQVQLKMLIWGRIQTDIRTTLPEQMPAQRPKKNPLPWMAAALLVLSLGGGLLLLLPPRWAAVVTSRRADPKTGAAADGLSQWVTRTTTTEAVQLALADGSAVTLQPNSRLRYPQQFEGPRREVYLQGEAFFRVARNPDRPFWVFTKQVVTTVLGTSFTVRAYPSQPQALVMVRTGRVRVRPRYQAAGPAARRTAAPVELIPNQQITYSPGAPELRKELVERPALLIPRSFAFDNRPVSEVLRALQHAYGVPIVCDEAALAGCTVRLLFKDEPLFEKLDLLCKALGASYERAGERIIFRSNGCRGKLRPAAPLPAGT